MWRPSRILSRSFTVFTVHAAPWLYLSETKYSLLLLTSAHLAVTGRCRYSGSLDDFRSWIRSKREQNWSFFIGLQSCMTILTKAHVFTCVLTVLKNLGVFMNSCFTFNTLICSVVKGSFYQLRTLTKLKPRQLYMPLIPLSCTTVTLCMWDCPFPLFLHCDQDKAQLPDF